MKYWPMLAKSGTTELFSHPDYVWEVKYDGVRCIAEIERNGDVTLYSRSGKVLDCFPDVTSQLWVLGASTGGIFLDGEIIARGGTFNDLQTRLQRKSNVLEQAHLCPAIFVAFDILECAGIPWVDKRYLERRLAIESLDIEIATLYRSPHQAWWDITANGGEGLVAKHKHSIYEPGVRSSSWLKIKTTKTREAYIGGCTWGYGRRAHDFGALLLMDPWTHTYIGSCGTGFTDQQLRDIMTLINDNECDGSLFVGFPATHAEADKIKSYCDIQRPLHIRVTYQEVTRKGILRFPSFAGFVS